MDPGDLQRRHLIFGIGAVLGGAAAIDALRRRSELTRDPHEGIRNRRTGFAYLGHRDDAGFNQSHALAAEKLEQQTGIQRFETQIPDPGSAAQMIVELIARSDCEVVFVTSAAIATDTLAQLASDHPRTTLFQYGAMLQADMPTNLRSYHGYLDEAFFLAGVIAANSQNGSRYGFVAAYPEPRSRRNINAFLLGAQAVMPGTRLQPVFTDTRRDPARERRAVEALAARGCSLIACDLEQPSTVAVTCTDRQLPNVTAHLDQTAMGNQLQLTGATWDWYPLYLRLLGSFSDTGKGSRRSYGSLRDGTVKLAPLGTPATSTGREQALAKLRALLTGKLHVYYGPLRGNDGRLLIPEGQVRPIDDPWLNSMDWYVEGVVA